MVRASIIVVAAFAAVAPVLAAPAPQTARPPHPRSIDTQAGELDARDPRFSFKNAFRSITRVASKVAPIALKAAPLLLREEGLSEFETRDVENGPIGEVYIRDEDGNVYVRALADEELAAALEARFNFGRFVKGGLGAARKGLGIAQKVSGGLSQFGLRDLEDLEDLDIRDLNEEELAALEARFNFGRFVKQGLGVARKGLGVAQKVSGGLSQFGLRELEDEIAEREFDDEELYEARSLEALD
ncbi:hypothetical protein D9611_004347 [Ephemerocybe angulata]|uniref:Uncharacterized protein n=1 Tax=Ephemerocybe angulata TaxID=980116 RepID=A0A8H5F5M1_9AGAR|nr:hypothetical protein D9611_004347 [Tulosesus angulatus]